MNIRRKSFAWLIYLTGMFLSICSVRDVVSRSCGEFEECKVWFLPSRSSQYGWRARTDTLITAVERGSWVPRMRGETAYAVVKLDDYLEEVGFRLGLEVWRQLEITVIINLKCLNGKVVLSLGLWALFLCFMVLYLSLWENLAFLGYLVLYSLLPALLSTFVSYCFFSPLCHLEKSVFVWQTWHLSGANDPFWFQFDLVSRPIVIESLQSSP